MGDRGGRVRITATVREAVGRHVEHAHDQRAAGRIVQPVIELSRSHAVVTLAIPRDDIKSGGHGVEWIHSVLREGKLYGMIALIASIVWISGYSARLDQRWRETVWMSALHTDSDTMSAGDWEPLYLSGLEDVSLGAR